MNSAIEVRDSISEDLQLNENLLEGVDFSIEGTDPTEDEETAETYNENQATEGVIHENQVEPAESREDVLISEPPLLNGTADITPKLERKRKRTKVTPKRKISTVLQVEEHQQPPVDLNNFSTQPVDLPITAELTERETNHIQESVPNEEAKHEPEQELPSQSPLCCISCGALVAADSLAKHAAFCSTITDSASSTPAQRRTSSRGYGTRSSSLRSIQSTYGPDACGLCGARGLSDGLARYLHTHLHHQRHACLFCGSMHASVTALIKHLQAVHGKDDRYFDALGVRTLVDVLGRAAILICTECGSAMHVLDAEHHSTSCKATPRFPLPSQVGYHSDGTAASPQQFSLAYPEAEAPNASSENSRKRRLKKPSHLASPPPAAEPEPASKKTTGRLKRNKTNTAPPLLELPPPEPFAQANGEAAEPLDASQEAEEEQITADKIPRSESPVKGLRTLLPGNRGPPPTPPKRPRPPGHGQSRVIPPMSQGYLSPKNEQSGTGEESSDECLTAAEAGPASEEQPTTATSAAAAEDEKEEEEQEAEEAEPEPEPEPEPSPVPQLPPREPTDWKSQLEPLLYKLILRVKKALTRIQLFHCAQCLKYETHESRLEDVCDHLKVAHNNHLFRGLGEDTEKRLYSEVNSIYMEDISREEAEEYVDSSTDRKALHKFCVEPLDKTYSCDLCNLNDLSVKEMVQHLRGAHEFRMYPCLECGQQFKTYGYFISHLVSTGKESIYGCRICGIVGIVSLYMLQSHLRTHSLCDICHTCYESQTALRKHMFNHQQDSPYACTVCQVSYKNYESLEMHLLWKHGTESKPCPTCNEKTWLCTYHFCPGAPANSAEVGDNPCVCTVCRLEFSKASMLKVHTRLHTGERPHKCAVCKKSFISKKLLGKHNAMKHSRDAMDQAAVAQAACNEIRQALEKSGLKPRKVQQELLKLIGQQNAAKRSAAPSRRVSSENTISSPVVPEQLSNGVPEEAKPALSEAAEPLSKEASDTEAPATTKPAAPLKKVMSIFDIEDEDVQQNGSQEPTKEDVSKEYLDGDKSIMDPLDLLASAATSQQIEMPRTSTPPPPAEPEIHPWLIDHDYCKTGEPPEVTTPATTRPTKKSHRHSRKKQHRAKKEPRFVLNLSSSSSDEDDDDAPGEKEQRPKKFTKTLASYGSDSSCCDSDCSCSSGSGSSSDSSSSSSDEDSSSDDTSSSSSSSSDSEVEVKPPEKTTPVNKKANTTTEDDIDIDVENDSQQSALSSSESEPGSRVESEVDVSVHESDLETSDSDSENKRQRQVEPERKESKKKKKKKKKKRRHYDALSAAYAEPVHLPSTGNNLDDVINAVAAGLINDLKRREPHVSHALPSPAMPSYPESGSRRSRGKRKFSDDSFFYDEQEMDGILQPKKKSARVKAPKMARVKPPKSHTSSSSKLRLTPNAGGGFSSGFATGPPSEDPDRLYCYCRCPYDEVSQMIGCDANDCPYEWFHFECVGISEAPEGQWYCPECRLRPKYRAQFELEPFFQPPPPPQQII